MNSAAVSRFPAPADEVVNSDRWCQVEPRREVTEHPDNRIEHPAMDAGAGIATGPPSDSVAQLAPQGDHVRVYAVIRRGRSVPGRTQRRVGSSGADSMPSEHLRNCELRHWPLPRVGMPAFSSSIPICSAPVLAREAPSLLPRWPSPQGVPNVMVLGFSLLVVMIEIQMKEPNPVRGRAT